MAQLNDVPEEDVLSQHALNLEEHTVKSDAPEPALEETKEVVTDEKKVDIISKVSIYTKKTVTSGSAAPPLEHEEWDADVKRHRYSNTCGDLIRNMDWFSVGKWVEVRPDDCFMPVMYKGKRCIFETPYSSCLFGLETYRNPDSHIRKYSLNFCLRTDGRTEMEDLVLFLNKLDEFTQANQSHANDVYNSSVQIQKRNKSATLRVKIPSYKNQLNIKIILEQSHTETVELQYPTVDEFNEYVRFNTKVSLMLLINNIWRAGGKYGISFKLLKMKIYNDYEDVDFRD